MQTLQFPQIPSDLPESLQFYLRELEAAMRQAAYAGNDSVNTRYLTSLPDKPQNGIYFFEANVTATVASRGMYRYDATTETYTFVI